MKRLDTFPACGFDVFFLLRIWTVTSALLLVSATGCGGGGEGEGGRTTGTAVRLIHSGIDVAPLDVEVSGLAVQQAAFADVTEFTPVSAGTTAISLNRANTAGATFRRFDQTLAPETEYTIFVAGSLLRRANSVLLLEESVVQPEAGRGRVQLLNGLEGSAALTLVGGRTSSEPIAEFGKSSGFFDVPAGPQMFTAVNGRGGPVGTFRVTVPDRGELTLVVEGSLPVGAIFTRVFTDLD